VKAKTLFAIALAAGFAQAQMTPEVAKQISEIGRGVCKDQTEQIYRPIHPNPPYAGITISRDQSFGSDPKNVADVFVADKGGKNRPILIFVPGGPGNRIEGGTNGDIFYDNVLLWAARNGMVGVNMQRRAGTAWDDPAKDISLVIQWAQKNAARYKGNPARIFVWAHSLGNVSTSTYIAHPEYWTPTGVGVKGVIFMSAAAFDILPAKAPTVAGPAPTCNQPSGLPAPAAAADAGRGGAGRGDAKGGGRGDAKGGGKAAPAEQPDEATMLARSNMPGLVKSKVPYMVSNAEFDPPNTAAFSETLKDELCKAGRCPVYLFNKGHNHFSEVMTADTADASVTGPVLKWMKSVK